MELKTQQEIAAITLTLKQECDANLEAIRKDYEVRTAALTRDY